MTYRLSLDVNAIRRVISTKQSVQHYPNGFDNPDYRRNMCICGIRDDISHMHMDTAYYEEYKRLLTLEDPTNGDKKDS